MNSIFSSILRVNETLCVRVNNMDPYQTAPKVSSVHIVCFHVVSDFRLV